MRIVIYGLAKSGTSALFYKVRNSLPPGTISLFEPSTYGPRDQLIQRLSALRRGHFAPDVVAKVLPCGDKAVRLQDFERFDRKVLIVRDPRDRLVSALLYNIYNASFADLDSLALEWLDLLRLKETEPLSVPISSLLRAFDRLERSAGSSSCWVDYYRDRGVAQALDFHGRRPRLPVFRYEQLVDGRFEPLEAMLGVALDGPAIVPPGLGRVVRTRSYGTWRNWFTPEDVDLLRPLFRPYLDRYYPAADWDLSPSPILDSNHGSGYVERIVNERRALVNAPPLPARSGA